MENKSEQPEEKDEIQNVGEPAMAYYKTQSATSENHLFTERKSDLINAILKDVEDEETLTILENFVYPTIYMENAPCQYSVEELKERIKESVKQIEEGNYYTHEQVKEMYKKWK